MSANKDPVAEWVHVMVIVSGGRDVSFSISVAMCTFNGKLFLPSQLESIVSQDRPPNELVVCDDGSSDGSDEIVRQFSRVAPFPTRLVINDQNLGSSRNFEKAISLSRGEVIVLADQDDIWLRHKLRTIEEQFSACPDLAAVFSDAALISDKLEVLPFSLWQSHSFGQAEQRAFAAGGAFDLLLKRPVVTGATLAFRRKYRDLILPIPVGHTHDYWISLLLVACGKVRPVAELLIQYRRHRAQQLGPGRKKSIREKLTQARTRDRTVYRAETELLSQWKQRLVDCASRFPVSSDAILKLDEKIGHGQFRATLPHSFLDRWPAIFREATNRNYWHYSGGWKSIGKDLFLLPPQ